MSETINQFLFCLPLISICPSPLFNFNSVLHPPPHHIQAPRPVGVGFCDGNHGPRRPLCLQRSCERGRLRERPRGADSSRAWHHRNHPQSFSGHICLHLHLRHIRVLLWARDFGNCHRLFSLGIQALRGFEYSEMWGSLAACSAGWRPMYIYTHFDCLYLETASLCWLKTAANHREGATGGVVHF